MSNDHQQAAVIHRSTFSVACLEYMIDAAQRSVLFWDVMRQRGNQYREHLAETVSACAGLQGRTCDGRPDAGAAGELFAGSHHAAGGRRD